MIIGKTAYDAAKWALKSGPTTPELVPVFTEFGLTPADLGWDNYKTWDEWLAYYGGPEHTGVTLTKEDVQQLRKALSFFAGYTPDNTAAFAPTSRAVLKKVGLRPEDLELSGTW